MSLPTEEQILERLPVWEALSEFFLDTELSPGDQLRIAGILAGSRYSEDELHGILRHEVYPACSLNLICVAGEWADWGEPWIRERIAPRYDHRPKIHLPAIHWHAIQGHWDAVRTLMINQRSHPASAPTPLPATAPQADPEDNRSAGP